MDALVVDTIMDALVAGGRNGPLRACEQTRIVNIFQPRNTKVRTVKQIQVRATKLISPHFQSLMRTNMNV